MSGTVHGNGPGILTDITKCIGCRECVIACKRENIPTPDRPRRWSQEDGLSSRNWTSVIERNHHIEATDSLEAAYVRKQCRHCLEPACVSACPVGALHITERGAVVYDGGKCMGCRYCMMACAYGIPRYDWDEAVPYVRKCILCDHRLEQGEQPACTEACPVGATVFYEDREEMLRVARERIAAEPDKYDDNIWGEEEIGGTRVLYLAPKNFDMTFLTYGQRLGEDSLPSLTAPAMNAVPFAFIGMGGTMAGIHWIVKRRMKRQAENMPQNSPETPDTNEEQNG